METLYFLISVWILKIAANSESREERGGDGKRGVEGKGRYPWRIHCDFFLLSLPSFFFPLQDRFAILRERKERRMNEWINGKIARCN